jgi:hypothetical protein
MRVCGFVVLDNFATLVPLPCGASGSLPLVALVAMWGFFFGWGVLCVASAKRPSLALRPVVQNLAGQRGKNIDAMRNRLCCFFLLSCMQRYGSGGEMRSQAKFERLTY